MNIWIPQNPIVKRVNGTMSEHTGLISSLSLLLVQTQAAKWKVATPEQLTSAKLYLDIAKSGYLFHAVGNVMLMNLIQNMCLEMTLLKLLPQLPGVDELIMGLIAEHNNYKNGKMVVS